jgi:hypothetical protein
MREINYSNLIHGHQYFIELNVFLKKGIRKNIKCKGIFVKKNKTEVDNFKDYYNITDKNFDSDSDDIDFYMNLYYHIHHCSQDLQNVKDPTFEDGYFPISKRKINLETEGFEYAFFKNVEFTNRDAIEHAIIENGVTKSFHDLMNKFNYTFIHEDTVSTSTSTSTSMWVKKPLSNTIQFYEVTSDVLVRKRFVHNLNLIADAKHVIREF